jgi:quercetin dioxygenase-like cupin family protein
MSITDSASAPGSHPEPLVVRKNEGTHLWTMGMLMTVKASAQRTNGEISAMEVAFPPGAAPPLHIHHHEAEINYVLDGQMRFQCGDAVYDCDPGDFVYLPRNTAHSFRAGSDGARMLAITVPAGIDELYERVGEPAKELRLPDTPPDVAHWLELAPDYNIEVLGPPVQ